MVPNTYQGMTRGGTNSQHALGLTAEGGFRINNNKNKNKSIRKRASRMDAQKQVELMRQKHNAELLAILEEEQRAEAERENKLKSVSEENERKRLEKIFGIERAKASERIVNASSEHERILNHEMEKLGLL